MDRNLTGCIEMLALLLRRRFLKGLIARQRGGMIGLRERFRPAVRHEEGEETPEADPLDRSLTWWLRD